MNSIRNFCIWIRAALGDSAAETILQNHYFSGQDGLKITTANYDATLVNINNFIATLKYKIVNQGIL